MPIFMDRHDVSETVTAEFVAQLHQADLRIQDQFGCKGLTYWFDDKRKIAFCLIEAPDAKAIHEMHKHAHGEVPHKVIEVEPTIVESFLGRIGDPEKAQNTSLNIINDPAFRTIMVISLKRVFPAQDDTAEFKSAFNCFTKAVLNILNMYNGSIVRQSGYQYLISFRSVTNTVHAAQDIRLLFKGSSNGILNERIALKTGLSAGIPVTEKRSIFEDTIKLAERMCEIVDGEIILSSDVAELYSSENTESLGKNSAIVPLSSADERFLTHLMDYTDATWNNANFKVDDFSKPLGCSKSQLYRKIISLTGQSPNSFIKEYRLREALKLLSRNAGNISEIAFETGFSSPSYFSKCFQKKFGRMPSEYLTAIAQ